MQAQKCRENFVSRCWFFILISPKGNKYYAKLSNGNESGKEKVELNCILRFLPRKITAINSVGDVFYL
jgi:hypothetical protein